MDELLHQGVDFAFETTLATKSYKQKIIEAQANGYEVTLLFFWLRNVTMAKERVAQRVAEGGHNIPIETIERRYYNGIINLFNLYIDIVDICQIYDNSNGVCVLIAEKYKEEELICYDIHTYNKIKNSYER